MCHDCDEVRRHAPFSDDRGWDLAQHVRTLFCEAAQEVQIAHSMGFGLHGGQSAHVDAQSVCPHARACAGSAQSAPYACRSLHALLTGVLWRGPAPVRMQGPQQAYLEKPFGLQALLTIFGSVQVA